MTEKLLLLGNAIVMAGTIKARKSSRHAASDWMKMEQERGISVTTSVMQFDYGAQVVNLLDTPGHEDFSEDTYRTLTAVDSALMVIDGSKGVEPRTIRLLEICRMRDTPVFTFINKLDREIRDPVELIDEIEDILAIECAPMSWPIGAGSRFRGVYLLASDRIVCYEAGHGDRRKQWRVIEGLASDEARAWLGDEHESFVDEVELVRGASHSFDEEAFLTGRRTPVFFGTALGNFGVEHFLDCFAAHAPAPGSRKASVNGGESRSVQPHEGKFSGFVFKIQANMDPKHRDRIAFLRVCSGGYRPGMRLRHVRIGRDMKVGNAVTFMAGDRVQAEEAWAGDIIGPLQPRRHLHRRHLHGGRGTALRGGAELRPGAVPGGAAAGPAQGQAVGEGRAAALGGGCDAGLFPAGAQRHRHRRGGGVAVRRGGASARCGISGGLRVRAGGHLHGALGRMRRSASA